MRTLPPCPVHGHCIERSCRSEGRSQRTTWYWRAHGMLRRAAFDGAASTRWAARLGVVEERAGVMDEIRCPGCGAEEIHGRPGSKGTITLSCDAYGTEWTRTPRASCPRCGKPDPSVREFLGWSFDALLLVAPFALNFRDDDGGLAAFTSSPASQSR